MKTTGFALLFCFAPAVAAAHDVRLGDGSEWKHDHRSTYFASGAIRNVSVTNPQITSCQSATWPDIPAECLRSAAAEVGKTATVAALTINRD